MPTIEDEAQAYAELILISDRLQQSAMCAAVALRHARPNGDGSCTVPAGTAQHCQNVRDTLACLAAYSEAMGT
jgi:hypothetical protein